MPVAVVKLGSSVVADDSGALRLAVVARVCEEVAALHGSGVDVVVVTSGAIARGIHLLGLPVRPRAVEELQAASAVGQGRLYRTYDEYLRGLDAELSQVLVVGAVEPPLANRARRLQLLDRPRPAAHPQQVDAARDRARGDDHDVHPGAVQRGDLLADPRDDGQAQLARVLGDDRGPELDDRDRH